VIFTKEVKDINSDKINNDKDKIKIVVSLITIDSYS